jgi:hypothetical protein
MWQAWQNERWNYYKTKTNLAQFKKNAFAQAQKFDISSILPQYEAFYEKVKNSGKCK